MSDCVFRKQCLSQTHDLASNIGRKTKHIFARDTNKILLKLTCRRAWLIFPSRRLLKGGAYSKGCIWNLATVMVASRLQKFCSFQEKSTMQFINRVSLVLWSTPKLCLLFICSSWGGATVWDIHWPHGNTYYNERLEQVYISKVSIGPDNSTEPKQRPTKSSREKVLDVSRLCAQRFWNEYNLAQATFYIPFVSIFHGFSNLGVNIRPHPMSQCLRQRTTAFETTRLSCHYKLRLRSTLKTSAKWRDQQKRTRQVLLS